MGAYSNSVAAIFQQGQSIASNWIVEDDITFSFGDSSNYKFKFNSSTGVLQIIDPSNNIMFSVEDTGSTPQLTIPKEMIFATDSAGFSEFKLYRAHVSAPNSDLGAIQLNLMSNVYIDAGALKTYATGGAVRLWIKQDSIQYLFDSVTTAAGSFSATQMGEWNINGLYVLAGSFFLNDSIPIVFGTGSDYSVKFDGTNLLFNPVTSSTSFKIGLTVFDTGNVFVISYTTAETTVGNITGVYIDLKNNLTAATGDIIRGAQIYVNDSPDSSTMHEALFTSINDIVTVLGDIYNTAYSTIGLVQGLYSFTSYLAGASFGTGVTLGLTAIEGQTNFEIVALSKPSGTFMRIDYFQAETLTGAIIGIDLDLTTNVTPDSQVVTGIKIDVGSTGIGIDFSTMSAGEITFKFVTDATDPTGAGGAATGRIAIDVGGATKYLAYY